VSKKARLRQLHATLDAIYARLPHLECHGRCASSCGAILVTQVEADRMRHAHPDRAPLKTTPIYCGYLTARQRCSVYAVRPLIDYEFVDLAAQIEACAGPLWTSTKDGLQRLGDSFARLKASIHAPEAMPPELVDQYATLTQGLRALHGGRIVGVHPRDDAENGWVDLDDLRRGRTRGR
jgi:hypothetical protein